MNMTINQVFVSKSKLSNNHLFTHLPSPHSLMHNTKFPIANRLVYCYCIFWDDVLAR